MLRIVLESSAGAMMLALGILFLIYLSDNATNVATDFIFLGAGLLIIQRAYRNSKVARIERRPERKSVGRERQKPNARKRN